MAAPSLDELVSSMDQHAVRSSNAAWALAQRLEPKIKNTDEERETLKRVIEEAEQAASIARDILARL